MAILPDNRLRLPAPEIDFINDVGVTGQEHDTYPTADTQARFDWMRMYLISLLAHQSSHLQPINFRTGTTWFDLEIEAYRYFNGIDFAPLAKGIKVPGEAGSEQDVNLYDWATSVIEKIASITKRAVFSGEALGTAASISVPTAAQEAASQLGNHPMLYKNGALIDPRLTKFSVGCPVSIELFDEAVLVEGDKFTVVIEKIDVLVPETIQVGAT